MADPTPAEPPRATTFYCPVCREATTNPLLCGDCGAILCRRCGAPLEDSDELGMG